METTNNTYCSQEEDQNMPAEDKSGIKQQLFQILESYIQNNRKIPEIPDLKPNDENNHQKQIILKKPLLPNQDNMFNIFDLDKLGFVGLKSYKYKGGGDCIITDFLVKNLKIDDFLRYKEQKPNSKSSPKCQICHQMSSINFNFGGQDQQIQLQEPPLSNIIKIPRDETKCCLNNDKIIKCLGCCINGKAEKEIESAHALCYSYSMNQANQKSNESQQPQNSPNNCQKLILLGNQLYYLCQKCLYNHYDNQTDEENMGAPNSIECYYCTKNESFLQINLQRNIYFHPVCKYLSQNSQENPQIWGNQCFKCGSDDGIKFECRHLECSKMKHAHINCLMKNGFQVQIKNPDDKKEENCQVFYLCRKSDVAYPEFFDHNFTRIVERIHSLISTNYEDIIIGERAFHYDMAHFFKAYKNSSLNFIDHIILEKTFKIFRQILIECNEQIFCLNKEVHEYFVEEEDENFIQPSDILESNFGYFDYQNFDDTYPLDIISSEKITINNDNYLKNEALREETITMFDKGLTQIFHKRGDENLRLSLPLKIGEFLEFKLDQLVVLTLFGEAFYFLNNMEDMNTRSTTQDASNSNDHTDTESYMEICLDKVNNSDLLALIKKFEDKDLEQTRTYKALKQLL